jgi:cytochrome P450
MSAIPESPELDLALVNPSIWADEPTLYSYFAWLRNNDPVRLLSPEGFKPFYAITKYHDIKEIELNKKIFLNDPRPILAPEMVTAVVEHMSGRKHLVRSSVAMDDPDHTKYRRLTQGWFMGENLRKLNSRIAELATKYVDRMAEMDGECDFVKDVAIWYPLRVIMSILGVPEEDEPFMMKLTQELFGGEDPDTQRSFELTQVMDVVRDFEDYFAAITNARRAHPQDDVASFIANGEVDGGPLPDLEANGYYIIIATAGHDTTSACTAGGLLALLENPTQMSKLRSNVDGHMDSYIDEVIRWVSPVRHFMRTACEDYELRGTTIKAGESVILWYPSANRDEEVFNDADQFRVDRKDAKQLAFGFGAHVCLGQHLARMEMAALYRELFARVDHIELAGEPIYKQATFVGGLKSLPIRYRMK